ncbi:hypothetical protein Aple_005800 [Acrocarpospora pleiomorpha]|uniref:DUF3224 domain-containing protein n=1 Tax=Acrocarpospora pleiomorpha TaxID=90975 RepID=A0A5M3X7N0_9ACTN|nr:DUF3224 domain-containing protein [Acrocarpospora pleiomorpha]GES17685.1 hypothetical protein Aple_005800 [Acrocarpospora pleiomorpha]
MHATGSFEITAWDTLATDEREGASIGRNRLTKTFHGDIAGTSVTELLTVATASGPAAYTGIEHLEGVLNGRKGTLVLRHNGGADGDRPWLTWIIVETSGTGELTGIHGQGQIAVDEQGTHTFTLDYQLPGT